MKRRQQEPKRGNFDVPACVECPSHPALWLDTTLSAAVCPRCGRRQSVRPDGVRVVVNGGRKW